MKYKQYLDQVHREKNDEFKRSDFIRLDRNEGVFDYPQSVINRIKEQINSNFLSCYPQPYLFKRSLSKFLGFPEENLYVCSGSDAAIKAAYEIFVSENDNVVIADPTYAMYKIYANLFHTNAKLIPYSEDLTLPIQDFIDSIDGRTKISFLANPDSPTGSVTSEENLESIAKRCLENNCAFLIDEAYHYFFHGNCERLLKKFDNVIIIRSFSKAMGLASLRLGYVMSSPSIIRLFEKVRPLYEINAFAVLTGIKVLETPQWIESNIRQFNEAKRYILRQLDSLKLKYFPVNSNFIHIKVGNAACIVDFMKRNGVLIKISPNMPVFRGFIRVSITKESDMKKFANLLKEYLRRRR